MIQSFADRDIEDFFRFGTLPKNTGWRSVATAAARKLDMLNYAESLQDLRSPPGNRLERLRGDLGELHSIRINDQWRIIFRWTDAGPANVEIVDYHK